MIRLGVDVGGTNTDAVLIEGKNILATTKQATTDDIQTGIVNAITKVVKSSRIKMTNIDYCMIGTTQFTNAFVQRQELNSVAIIRLGLPAAAALPPLSGWQNELKDAFEHKTYMLQGGHHFDGKVNSDLNEMQLDEAIQDILLEGYPAVTICSIFSPINQDFELLVENKIKQVAPHIRLSLSHQIGRVGLMERENSAIMNASLACLADKVVNAFENSLSSLGVTAPLYITQNDGTLMSADAVRKYPVMTFASGPTNSMRGAAFLSGLKDAIVADIGGTTTDIGMLQDGFPRESSVHVDIGGVRTNFRMPDIIALGLGGGSIIDPLSNFSIGPQSVGYKLLQQGKSFGGTHLTTTDIAIKRNYIQITGSEPNNVSLTEQTLKKIENNIDALLVSGLDQIKTSSAEVPLILVGGGHCIIKNTPKGISKMISPKHAEVANAIGASIGQVAGEIEHFFEYQTQPREECIAQAKQMAIDKAIIAGAIASTVSILDIQEIPLSYVKGQATRIKVKATGQLF
ncbi:MAG: hydantoinase/oxoprolinase family protein [Litorilituus sp.]|jgi:N-methylhydantoinase A/oxoprolinase/acetone carboxylase beta subunit|nr:hydantoinase/oxoprolinase family protein [Litorilituus sp.]